MSESLFWIFLPAALISTPFWVLLAYFVHEAFKREGDA